MVKVREIEVRTVCAVAPEDLREGDVVVVLQEYDQVLARVGESGVATGSVPEFRIVRVRSVPQWPRALRVIAVALPVVLVEDTDGDELLIDVRLRELGRLPEAVGARAMRALDERRSMEAKERADAAGAGCTGGENPRAGAD